MAMRIKRWDDDWNKIDSKKALVTLLRSYEGILNREMIDYLNSLINLEFSVIRDYVSSNDKASLAELEVYKRIAMYNIYRRALNLFKKSKTELDISGNNEGIEGLMVYLPLWGKSEKLFDYQYAQGFLGFEPQVPEGYKTMHIGNISLYKTIEDVEKRKTELMRVKDTLERLRAEQNPYSGAASSWPYSKAPRYGGPASTWAFQHTEQIEEYEKRLKELDGKTYLTDEEKREIEITTKFHSLLLEDYGLTDESFKRTGDTLLVGEEESELRRELVYKQPNITITNHIKYL